MPDPGHWIKTADGYHMEWADPYVHGDGPDPEKIQVGISAHAGAVTLVIRVWDTARGDWGKAMCFTGRDLAVFQSLVNQAVKRAAASGQPPVIPIGSTVNRP